MKQILILGNATELTLGSPGHGIEVVDGVVCENYINWDQS